MTTYNEFGRMEPIANIGDLVSARGHGMRIFEVVAFSHEFHVDVENTSEEIYYDLRCVTTSEYNLADQSDILIIEQANGKPIEYMPEVMRVEEDSTSVNALLDELRDAMNLIEIFGEHEDDEKKDRKYALKVDEIKAKLKEAVNENAAR